MKRRTEKPRTEPKECMLNQHRTTVFKNLKMIPVNIHFPRRRSGTFPSDDWIFMEKQKITTKSRRIIPRLCIPIPRHKYNCIDSPGSSIGENATRSMELLPRGMNETGPEMQTPEIRQERMKPETNPMSKKPTVQALINGNKLTSTLQQVCPPCLEKLSPFLEGVQSEGLALVRTEPEIPSAEKKSLEGTESNFVLTELAVQEKSYPVLKKQTAFCNEVECYEPTASINDRLQSGQIYWDASKGPKIAVPCTMESELLAAPSLQTETETEKAPVLSGLPQTFELNHAFWEDIPLLPESPADVTVGGLSISDLENLYEAYKRTNESIRVQTNIPLIDNMESCEESPAIVRHFASPDPETLNAVNEMSTSEYDNVASIPLLSEDEGRALLLEHFESPSTSRVRQKVEPVGILRAESSRSSGRTVGFREEQKLRQETQAIRSNPITVNGSSWPSSTFDSKSSPPLLMERPSSISSSAKHPRSDEDNDEEDYSASASAIISRVSTGGRRRTANRRASSHSPEFSLPSCNRRRSSVFTTSSAETAVSADEGLETSQEQMYENMRLHKEVLNGVRLQPWPMRRKLWLVKQAKLFLSKHEGQLQERLAQSKRTKDLLARFNIFFTKQWQNSKRELANLMNILIPWELRIKEIESHFGSAVASYFTFLRWLFWVNLVISIFLIAFVAVPEVVLVNHHNKDTSERKTMLPEEKANSTSFETLWNFEGILRYSPLFYGYYSNREGFQTGYRLPMAYFLTGIGVYVYSFIATLRRMAVNSRQSKLSEKEDECVFTWKLFTGWDYMIGNAETAHNRTSSIVLSFKEALLEEAEKKREDLSWKIIFNRILVNVVITSLLVCSAYAVVFVVERSTMPDKNSSWWRQNEINIVINFIGSTFPHMFELLGALERYHPRKSLRIHLARIMALNLLNTYTFMFALFDEISNMTNELRELKSNLSLSTARTTPTAASKIAGVLSEGAFLIGRDDSLPGKPLQAMSLIAATSCHRVPINCSLIGHAAGLVVGVSSVFSANLSNVDLYPSSTENTSFLTQNNSLITPNTFETDLNFIRSPDVFLNNVTSDEIFLNVTDLDSAESSLLETDWNSTESFDDNETQSFLDIEKSSTLAIFSESTDFYTTETPPSFLNVTAETMLNETVCYVTVCGPAGNTTWENSSSTERVPDLKGEGEDKSSLDQSELPKTAERVSKDLSTNIAEGMETESSQNITEMLKTLHGMKELFFSSLSPKEVEMWKEPIILEFFASLDEFISYIKRNSEFLKPSPESPMITNILNTKNNIEISSTERTLRKTSESTRKNLSVNASSIKEDVETYVETNITEMLKLAKIISIMKVGIENRIKESETTKGPFKNSFSPFPRGSSTLKLTVPKFNRSAFRKVLEYTGKLVEKVSKHFTIGAFKAMKNAAKSAGPNTQIEKANVNVNESTGKNMLDIQPDMEINKTDKIAGTSPKAAASTEPVLRAEPRTVTEAFQTTKATDVETWGDFDSSPQPFTKAPEMSYVYNATRDDRNVSVNYYWDITTIFPVVDANTSSDGTSPFIDTFPSDTPSAQSIPVNKSNFPEENLSIPNRTLPETVTLLPEGTQEPDAPIAETPSTTKLDINTRRRLRRLCWETMFGQEIVKLTVGDLVMTILSTILIDFLRALFVRFMNRCWCWDLEKNFPQYGDFKIAENILHLINNQGMVWMGIFFSPGLPLINVIKLIIIMYLRAWAVLTCNVPHEIVFRASRSNNFFFALLLLMLFLCVLPVGYAIVWVEPSWHCGPFSQYKRIYYIFTFTLKKIVPGKLHRVMDYVASPGIVIPLLMLLVLVIYYLLSLTSALREANNDLKTQLRRERTEERRKMFQIADRRRRGIDDYVDSTLVKWKQILPEVQANSDKIGDDEDNSNSSPHGKAETIKRAIKLKRKGTMAEIVKQAMSKNVETTELQKEQITDENADTDVEQQESLSEDAAKKVDQKNAMTGPSLGNPTEESGRKKKKSKKGRSKEKSKKDKTSEKKIDDKVEKGTLYDSNPNIPKIQISESSSPDSRKLSENSGDGSAETVVTPKLPSSFESVLDAKTPEVSTATSLEEASDPVPAIVSVENERSTAEAEGNRGQKPLKFGLFRKVKTTPVNRDPEDQTWTNKRNKMAENRTLSLSHGWKKKHGGGVTKTSAASESDLTKEV